MAMSFVRSRLRSCVFGSVRVSSCRATNNTCEQRGSHEWSQEKCIRNRKSWQHVVAMEMNNNIWRLGWPKASRQAWIITFTELGIITEKWKKRENRESHAIKRSERNFFRSEKENNERVDCCRQNISEALVRILRTLCYF